MVTYERQFDSYMIYHNSRNDYAEAEIDCYDKEGVKVGTLIFEREYPTSKNRYDEATKRIILFYPVSRFNDIITTLRYEKPLSLSPY